MGELQYDDLCSSRPGVPILRTEAIETVMTPLECRPIDDADLPEIAQYVHEYEKGIPHAADSAIATEFRSAEENLAFLRWALVDNPLRVGKLGFQLRNDEGRLVGFRPICPFQFNWRAQTLRGVASSTFFVSPE